MFKVRYRYFFIAALAVYSYLNIRLTANGMLLTLPISAFRLFLTLLCIVFLIWELNRVIAHYATPLAKRLSIPHLPLVIIFGGSLLSVVLSAIITLYAFDLMTSSSLWNRENLVLLLAFGFRVNLFLNCINAIVFYIQKSKTAEIEARNFEKASIEAQFSVLRNQINPHFLFNCFNVLSTLVYKDADTSAKFISQLSQVYRYLLYNQEKKIVTLHEELSFLDAYFFLLRIRFGDNIILVNEVPNALRDHYVAPAVLQMLIENAIKHNVISRKNPLRISLFAETDGIVVSNNLQEKEVKETSSQIGLQNIIRRYEFLSDEKVLVTKTTDGFRVKVPLLQIEML